MNGGACSFNGLRHDRSDFLELLGSAREVVVQDGVCGSSLPQLAERGGREAESVRRRPTHSTIRQRDPRACAEAEAFKHFVALRIDQQAWPIQHQEAVRPLLELAIDVAVASGLIAELSGQACVKPGERHHVTGLGSQYLRSSYQGIQFHGAHDAPDSGARQ